MDDIDRRIVKLVRESWEGDGRPLLLSRLGGEDDIATQAKNEEGGLAIYLRRRLFDDVKVVQHSAKPSVIAAIPVDVGVDSDGGVDALLDKTYGRTTDTERKFLHPALWAAFRAPLDETNERYVKLDDPIRFKDVAPENRPIDQVEINRKYVADPNATPSQIYENIERWAAEKDLNLDVFSSGKSTRGESLPTDDLLGRFLLALDTDDLEKISMPLDVVKKLRRQSI